MRLTALCIYGTLLALTCLSWTTGASGEGDVLGDKGIGPCAATLQLEGPCRQEQEEITCPYLVSLPPLTVHLPSQLRELEKIVMDLQSLKDDVDQLRKMCADCTVSQTESECETQRERENVNLNERTERQEDERNWVNERNPKRLKDVGDQSESDRVNVETAMEGDGDTDSEKRAILEERGKKKWEAERESIKGVIKENEKTETFLEVVEKDGKTQTEEANVKDKLGQAKLPTAGGNRKTEEIARERVVEVNNKETERNKEMDKTGDSVGNGGGVLESDEARKITTDIKTKKTGGSDQPSKQDAIKETDEETNKDRGGDGIKMSEEHTNKERKQDWEESTKKKEKGVKVVQNNEELKQTESTEHTETEKTIKRGEGEAGSRVIKTEGAKVVQSVQRDSDGEATSNKAIEMADLVSVSQTLRSTISSAPRLKPSDSSKATIVTSPLSSSSMRLITDGVQTMTIAGHGQSAQSTGIDVADVSPTDADQGYSTTSRPPPTTTMSPLDVPRQQITSVNAGFTPSTLLTHRGFHRQISSTVATTTTSTLRIYSQQQSQNLFPTTVTGVTDRSQWTIKNISSNTDRDVKSRPSQGTKATEKHQHGIRPEADRKLKNSKNDHKPEGTSPDKKSKYNQKQKPPLQKPVAGQKPRPNKNRLQVHIPKPDQRFSLDDNLTTYQNLTNNSASKHDHDLPAVQNKFNVQKPKSQPKTIPQVQKRTSHQGPGRANTTGSDKDPLTDQLNLKPVKNSNTPLQTEKNEPKQIPEKKLTSKEKTNPDLKTESNLRFTPVLEAESETAERAELTPKPNQESVTELMGNSDENPPPWLKSDQDLPPRQNLSLDHIHTHTDQKPKPSQKIPVINKNSTLGRIPKPYQKRPELSSGKKTKPNVKTKPGQSPQKKQGLKTPQLGEMPRLSQKSVPTKIPEVGSNKTKPRPSPGHGLTLKPGATSVQKPGPAVVPKSSPEIKTDKDLPVSRNIADDTQNSQIDRPATSGHVKVSTEVTHYPGDTKKSTALPPNTSNRPKTGPFPLLHTVSEGFTVSPDSRITSDLGPQTAGQPSSIPMTTRPNKMIHGILPSVIPSTFPGSTKLSVAPTTESSLKASIFDNAEETAPKETPQPQKVMIPVLPSRARATSTLITDIRSTTPATSDPKAPAAEYSTPGAHELRVKINQVAAFPSDSQSSSGRLLDMRRKERPKDDHGGRGSNDRLPMWIPSKVKRDCSDHLVGGGTKSGVYLVTPDIHSNSFPVFCDMELDGGGWTLLQRRQDGSVSFNRTWAEYSSGFGEVDGGEFWLGNNMIHLLTRDRDMVLRVELEDFDGVMEYAEYERFKVASERLRFRLTVGGYSGTAGDALRFSKSYDHNNRPFTTPDRDNDRYPSGNCGAYYSSGWWFDACMAANLNGRYYEGKYTGVRDGIFWGTWHNISMEYYPTNERRSFKTVRMMIRPKGFAP